MAHPLKTVVALFFAFAMARAICAQPAYLVKDINRQPADASQQPAWFSGFVGGTDQLLFGAYDPHDGFALWSTGGTPGSTRLVKSASDVQYPSDFIVFGNLTFFVAYDSGGNSWALWKSDGTTLGTTLVKRFASNGGIVPGSLVVLNGGLYFAGGDETQGRGIWKTDGTTEGTVLVKSLSGGIGTFVVFRGELFFFRGTEDGQVGLWRSNGTESGTRVVKSLAIPSYGESPYGLTASGQNVYFFLFDDGPKYRLWKSDGTDAGTIPVRDFAADTYEIGYGQFPYFGPDQPLDVGGNLFFAANDGVHGRAVWSTDGTVPGTSMRSDGVALPTNEGPVLVGSVGSSVLFFTSDEGGPAHLWKTSGSTEAAALKDFIAAPIFSFETTIVEAGGAVYFWAEDQEHGVELWRSDATAVGTALVADIVPGPGSSNAYPLAAKSGNVFFSVSLGPDAPSIWKVDTQGNTTLLRLFRAENEGSNLFFLTPVADRILFGVASRELWSSDGTEAGTSRVKEFVSFGDTVLVPSNFAALGVDLFFRADDGSSGVELWKSDGTPGGTVLVRDLNPGPGDSYPYYLTPFGGALIFTAASDSTGGWGLFRTDGTSDGTTPLQQIFLGADDTDSHLQELHGELFFPAFTFDPNTQALWKTDGTQAGTQKVADIGLYDMVRAGELLFFIGIDELHGFELWASNGTTEGTRIVLDINPGPSLTPVGNIVFFTTDTGTAQARLWRSDGTGAGTAPLDIAANTVANLTASGSRLFFTAVDSEHGAELWVSDGTSAGTRMVADIDPGAASSNPSFLFSFGRGVVFAATDGEHGSELWFSDGSETGTRMVQDISDGPSSSTPSNFAATNSLLYFTADDGIHGGELWAIPSDAVARGRRAGSVGPVVAPPTAPISSNPR